MKLSGRFLLLAAIGCSAGFTQDIVPTQNGYIVTHPLRGYIEGMKEAARLRMEAERVRALNEESAARAEAIRAQTEQLRRQQKMLEAGTTQGSRLDDSDWTAGMFNGRGWRKIDQPMKMGFAVGYDNARYILGEKGQDLFPPATYGEVVIGLDRFYQNPENAALPIMMGLRAFALKLKGSTDADIESEMAAARKMVSAALAQSSSK